MHGNYTREAHVAPRHEETERKYIGAPRSKSVSRAATRVVATLGPASRGGATIQRLVRAGVNVFRFNMSHGDHETHGAAIDRVHAIAETMRTRVGVLVDLQGPKLRTGANEGEDLIPLKTGERVKLVGSGKSAPGRVAISFPPILRALSKGDQILLDDGRMVVRVQKRVGDELWAEVERGGRLKERAGVNVPGRVSGVEVPTRKDARDAAFALRKGADFVALSFVQSAEDLRRLRRLLQRAARREGGHVPAIVAKIEKPSALEQLDEILHEADGVMVARGDLGVEISLAKVPLWQKEILLRARRRGVFTITATQMLESMISSAVPTRAEVSDVANAVFDGTDALMLSAESAIGQYPVEAVSALGRIARATEEALPDRDAFGPERGGDPHWHGEPIYAVVRAAVELATAAEAQRIVAITKTGRTGYLLARHRPRVPVVALAAAEHVRRRLTLAWNTDTAPLPVATTADEQMRAALETVRSVGLARRGDAVVLVGGNNPIPGMTNFVRLARVE